VDVDAHAYELLVAAIRETTPLLNALHAGEPHEATINAWRPDFTSGTPAGSIPYLDVAPEIDGSLRDWSEAHRIPHVQRGDVIGADRMAPNLPKIFAGWNEQGLWLAVEVPDRQIQAAPPTGPWWTQDAVELFVSTLPTAQGRPERGFTHRDHQWFFVPNPFPLAGSSGTWSRWSRPGDALGGEHQIPARGLRDAARVLPGRYVTELFIPAEQLNGFCAETLQAIRFNVNVRDYQTATDFFWSAPKSAGMQYRPATWGRLDLQRPAPATPGEAEERTILDEAASISTQAVD